MPQRNIKIQAWEGVDTTSNHNVARITRMNLAENARSVSSGAVETRDGSVRVGTADLNGGEMISNLGLFRHPNESSFAASGIYRFMHYDPAGAGRQRTALAYLNPDDEWTPFSVVLPSDDAVVSSSVTGKVYRLDGFGGAVTDSFSSPSTGSLTVAYPADGNLVSSDSVTDKVYRHLGFSSTIQDSFSSPSTGPSGLSFIGSDLVSADAGTDKIYRHEGFSSTVTDSFSAPSTTTQGLAVEPSGDVVSADAGTDKIYRFDGFSSTITDSFSSPGTAPTALDFDISGNLVSVDGTAAAVYRHDGFSSDVLESFATPFLGPTGVAMGYSADLYRFLELGDSDTLVTTSNVTGDVWRYSRVSGTPFYAYFKVAPGSEIRVHGDTFPGRNNGTFTVVASGNDYFDVINADGVTMTAKSVGTNGSITLAPARFVTANADGVTLVVNGSSYNFAVGKDGYPLVNRRPESDPLSSDAHYLSNFIKAPTAGVVNYYKGRAYLGDIRNSESGTVAPERFQNHIAVSSPRLGIIALVDEDLDAGATEIQVSGSTKYVLADGDSLDVYRGGTFVTNLTVTGKTQTSILVEETEEDIQSADELWLAGTRTGEWPKVFRWPDVVNSGADVTRYDTFPLSGGSNGPITMMANIGDVMVVANSDNVGVWNDYSLRAFNGGVGCASRRGWTKCLNRLHFFDRNGMYETGGGEPVKVSTPVDAVFRGATREGIENGAMGTRGFSVFAALGDVTFYKEDGSVDYVVRDLCLERDVVKNFWYIHSNVPAEIFLNA